MEISMVMIKAMILKKRIVRASFCWPDIEIFIGDSSVTQILLVHIAPLTDVGNVVPFQFRDFGRNVEEFLVQQ
jgi:hypothetical protein